MIAPGKLSRTTDVDRVRQTFSGFQLNRMKNKARRMGFSPSEKHNELEPSRGTTLN